MPTYRCWFFAFSKWKDYNWDHTSFY